MTCSTANELPFLSTFPAGPVFTAIYATPASGTPASADTSIISSGITQVNDVANAAAAVEGIVAGIVGARFVETLGVGVTKGAVQLTTDG